MKKFILILSILLLAGCSHSDDSNVVKIGVTAPLTGELAFMGEGMRNAMEIALQNLDETKYQYELIFEDDMLQNRLASIAAQKLITQDNVDAIVSFGSGTGNVVTPLANQYEVIHFGIASDSNVANGFYNFIHWTPPEEEVKVWLEEAADRGYQDLAIIELQQQGVLAISNELVEKSKERDINVVFRESFNAGTKDFRTILLKAQETGPDVYLIFAFSPDLENLYKQMKELGIEEPITGIESFEFSSEPELFEGEWYVNSADYSAEFGSQYEETFGLIPSLGAANAYDIVNLIVEAFEETGDGQTKPTSQQIANQLLTIKDFQGALGSLDIGEDGIIASLAAVRTIKDGKPVTID